MGADCGAEPAVQPELAGEAAPPVAAESLCGAVAPASALPNTDVVASLSLVLPVSLPLDVVVPPKPPRPSDHASLASAAVMKALPCASQPLLSPSHVVAPATHCSSAASSVSAV